MWSSILRQLENSEVKKFGDCALSHRSVGIPNKKVLFMSCIKCLHYFWIYASHNAYKCLTFWVLFFHLNKFKGLIGLTCEAIHF